MEECKYYIISNNLSGSGREYRTVIRILKMFKKSDIPYKAYMTKYKGHARFLAAKITKDIARDREIHLIVLGGDGTVNEVLNGIFDLSKVILSVYPTGSGNDFIRGLRIKRTPEEFFEAVTGGDDPFSIDLGKIYFADGTSHLFGISAGIGMDALVCRKAGNSILKPILNRFNAGKLTYILLTIETIFTMRYVQCDIAYTLLSESGEITYQKLHLDRMIYMAVLNAYAEGGGVKMAPGAKMNDNLFNICGAHGMSRIRGFLTLPSLARGAHKGKRGIHTDETYSFTLKTSSPMVVHTDGEDMGERDYMHVECLFDAVRMV